MADQEIEALRRKLVEVVASEKAKTNEWLAKATQATDAYIASLHRDVRIRHEQFMRRYIQRAIKQHDDFVAQIREDLPEKIRAKLIQSARESLERTIANLTKIAT